MFRNAHFEGVERRVMAGVLSAIIERIDEVLEVISFAICA
jgi:hypothetical protein